MRTNSKMFLLFDSIPDNEKLWKEMYDPDIDHLVNSSVLPPEIWRQQDLKSIDVMLRSGVIDSDIND